MSGNPFSTFLIDKYPSMIIQVLFYFLIDIKLQQISREFFHSAAIYPLLLPHFDLTSLF